ncbi:UDP-N-acetylglucosamine 1-carboxyvinyltransferase [Marinicella sp. S1101]|uniref:UDP-N-acetylglucosamine 1-carboxyvinyltransferase n=1 Tax=Marinicella marina TaxID=2996016 RepID=UPI002260A5C8|nr:UDP-N-acetylglucosamine 1-carboxyvinyltransferase [Marinicella marina]MCX7554622.1 UDP-N-acetylglucosamine 1-carboxyvinyltransferase [Marinicella marina]MDJ1140687.1 UDP-N-acetylglucosamine 1-carboxyvinyltransferase [Marinicella marina]
MNQITITGGQTIQGTIAASGAKNAVLPILAATIVGQGESHIKHVPHLHDVTTMNELLAQLGAKLTVDHHADITINTDTINNQTAPYETVKTMRASILALGPLVARYGRAKVSLPGGCQIGARPVDLHIKGLQAMGAKIEVQDGYILANCERLKGNRIMMEKVTVTGTENILIAATLAKGETLIENAAIEPEVVDLAKYLKAMGAEITGEGTSKIYVQGKDQLQGTTYSVMPDRIEIGTFLVAAAITGGSITINNSCNDDLDAVFAKLVEAGAEITTTADSVTLNMHGKRPTPVDIRTAPHPAFPTDMQAQFCALNAIADGTSHITETLFENRFMHVEELNRMGANIQVEGNQAMIKGVDTLSGAPVTATDLRASASLVLAGLAATGQTTVHDIHYIDRGYEAIEEKLNQLGAVIVRS